MKSLADTHTSTKWKDQAGLTYNYFDNSALHGALNIIWTRREGNSMTVREALWS